MYTRLEYHSRTNHQKRQQKETQKAGEKNKKRGRKISKGTTAVLK
jgi:hypothetical protein